MRINLSSKLATVWDLSDYKGKQELQFLLFPDGIYYNRKTEGCRTPKVNEVFSYISSLQRALGQEKSGNTNHRLDVSRLGGVGRDRTGDTWIFSPHFTDLIWFDMNQTC